MYSNVKACVRTPVGIKDFFTCSRGVQQGSILSPLLFSLFVNDFGEQMNKRFSGVYVGILKLCYLFFADDLAMVSSTPIGLQRHLDDLEKYVNKLQLKVNINKTAVMVFRKEGSLHRSYK